MNADNSSLGPPPLQTPLTVDNGGDETGTPYQHRRAQGGSQASALAVAWSAWFNQVFDSLVSNAGGSSAIPYIVPIVAGTATPDASKGTNVLILTAANTLTDANGNKYMNVAQPLNYSTVTGLSTPWQLITQQDPVGNTGGYSVVFDSTYVVGFSVASTQSPANTQSIVNMRTSATGTTTPTSQLTDQNIS